MSSLSSLLYPLIRITINKTGKKRTKNRTTKELKAKHRYDRCEATNEPYRQPGNAIAGTITVHCVTLYESEDTAAPLID